VDLANVYRRVMEQVVRRAGIEPAAFDSIADAPVYEILDSLDVVELLAAVELEFGTRLDPDTFRWESQPTVRQLTELLSKSVLK
jgi:acyl carrier protein